MSLLLAPSSSIVWCASVDGAISIYDVTTLRCVKVIRCTESPSFLLGTEKTVWVSAGNMIMLCNPVVCIYTHARKIRKHMHMRKLTKHIHTCTQGENMDTRYGKEQTQSPQKT